MQTSLVRKEIDRNTLSKRALTILERCDKLINHYLDIDSGVDSIALYPNDYRLLKNALKEVKQDLRETVYRGYRLISY